MKRLSFNQAQRRLENWCQDFINLYPEYWTSELQVTVGLYPSWEGSTWANAHFWPVCNRSAEKTWSLKDAQRLYDRASLFNPKDRSRLLFNYPRNYWFKTGACRRKSHLILPWSEINRFSMTMMARHNFEVNRNDKWFNLQWTFPIDEPTGHQMAQAMRRYSAVQC